MDDKSNLLSQARSAPEQRLSIPAVVSFVAGNLSLAGLILGLLFPWMVYLFLGFLPAIVAAHLARRSFRKSPGVYRNESMATFGISIGYLGLSLSIFVIILMASGIAD